MGLAIRAIDKQGDKEGEAAPREDKEREGHYRASAKSRRVENSILHPVLVLPCRYMKTRWNAGPL